MGWIFLLLMGCGDALVDFEWASPSLLHIEGTVDASSALPAEPRAAALWLSAAPLGLALQADDVALEAEFPARYEVDIRRIPRDDQLPGAWKDVPYLPEVDGVHTLFGVLVVYEDVNGNERPDFDFTGYHLLDWLHRRTDGTAPLLTGQDRVLGLAPDFLVAAVELPRGALRLGDVLPRDDPRDLSALEALMPGLNTYRWRDDAWRVGATEEVVLEVGAR